MYRGRAAKDDDKIEEAAEDATEKTDEGADVLLMDLENYNTLWFFAELVSFVPWKTAILSTPVFFNLGSAYSLMGSLKIL